jgi:hypothetical protein
MNSDWRVMQTNQETLYVARQIDLCHRCNASLLLVIFSNKPLFNMKNLLILYCLLTCLFSSARDAYSQNISGLYACEKVGSFRFNVNGSVAMLDARGKTMINLRYEKKDRFILISGPHGDIKLPILSDGNLEFRDGSQAALICKKQEQ